MTKSFLGQIQIKRFKKGESCSFNFGKSGSFLEGQLFGRLLTSALSVYVTNS